MANESEQIEIELDDVEKASKTNEEDDIKVVKAEETPATKDALKQSVSFVLMLKSVLESMQSVKPTLEMRFKIAI